MRARRRSVGDDEADDISIVTFFGGCQRSIRASALRHVHVEARFGGVDLDLCEATLDPDGAELVVDAGMGGVKVTVPTDWRVTVEQTVRAGGVEVRVTPVDVLSENAPSLRMAATARMGGVLVTTRAEG